MEHEESLRVLEVVVPQESLRVLEVVVPHQLLDVCQKLQVDQKTTVQGWSHDTDLDKSDVCISLAKKEKHFQLLFQGSQGCLTKVLNDHWKCDIQCVAPPGEDNYRSSVDAKPDVSPKVSSLLEVRERDTASGRVPEESGRQIAVAAMENAHPSVSQTVGLNKLQKYPPEAHQNNKCVLCGQSFFLVDEGVAELDKHLANKHSISWDHYLSLFDTSPEKATQILDDVRLRTEVQEELDLADHATECHQDADNLTTVLTDLQTSPVQRRSTRKRKQPAKLKDTLEVVIKVEDEDQSVHDYGLELKVKVEDTCAKEKLTKSCDERKSVRGKDTKEPAASSDERKRVRGKDTKEPAASSDERKRVRGKDTNELTKSSDERNRGRGKNIKTSAIPCDGRNIARGKAIEEPTAQSKSKPTAGRGSPSPRKERMTGRCNESRGRRKQKLSEKVKAVAEGKVRKLKVPKSERHEAATDDREPLADGTGGQNEEKPKVKSGVRSRRPKGKLSSSEDKKIRKFKRSKLGDGEPSEGMIVCPYCNYQFRQSKAMRRHLLNMHKYESDLETKMLSVDELWNSEDPSVCRRFKLSCHYCSCVRTIRRLHVHMASCHASEPDYAQNLAKIKVQSVEARKQRYRDPTASRQKELDAVKKKWLCLYCGMEFPYPQSCSKHEKYSCKENPARVRVHECGICHHKTLRMSEHIKHKAIHAGQRTKLCDLCGKEYRTRSGLISHRRRAHCIINKQPMVMHQCTVCTKTFSQACRLKLHMEYHSEERRYKCSFCGHNYKSRKNLANHMRLKHLNRTHPYHCTFCLQGANNYDDLRTHQCGRQQERFCSTQELEPHLTPKVEPKGPPPETRQQQAMTQEIPIEVVTTLMDDQENAQAVTILTGAEVYQSYYQGDPGEVVEVVSEQTVVTGEDGGMFRIVAVDPAELESIQQSVYIIKEEEAV